MKNGGDKAEDHRRKRLAQALRENLRLRKQAGNEEMPRREDRLEPRIPRHGESAADGENHTRKP